jgi:hypothetical protein
MPVSVITSPTPSQSSLSVCPEGHVDRKSLLSNLIISLHMRYVNAESNTHSNELLVEIHTLALQGHVMNSPSTAWKSAVTLAWLHSQSGTSFYNTSSAIQHLSESLINHPDCVSRAIVTILHVLDQTWETILNDCDHLIFVELIPLYQRLIRLLPFLSNPVLETPLQSQALRKSRQLGPDAFVNAALGGHWRSGLEDLEVVQGYLWSQRLHYRDPQLEYIPEDLAKQLKDDLRGISTSDALPDSVGSSKSALTPHDIRHNRVAHLHTVLREVRAIPGLERFMLGETFARLSSAAFHHPIVVLVGAHGRSYALLLASGARDSVLLPLEWSSEEFYNQTSDRHHLPQKVPNSVEHTTNLGGTALKTQLSRPVA